MPIVPLSHSAHGELRLTPGTLQHVQRQPLLPVSVAEAPRAALDLPLVFARTEAGLHLLALLSPDPADNAQIGPKGRWMGGYVPAALRAHPFRAVGDRPEQEGDGDASMRLSVLIDTDSDWLSRDEGQPLFAPDGQPTEVLEQRLQLLRTQAPNAWRDSALLAAIDTAQVLLPWHAAPEQLPSPLYTLSHERLAALLPPALAALRDAGALALLYAQHHSLARLQRLQQLAKRKAQMSERQNASLSADDDFVLRFDAGDDEPFQFD